MTLRIGSSGGSSNLLEKTSRPKLAYAFEQFGLTLRLTYGLDPGFF